uniref:AraC family transcriptional regulator n=1 Tax=Ningiella ruwaisensis TaxID=2364274 RepID=UPI0010A0563A|nr:AraC family transcriptional regulator [Ningiella ruwaisensis]
MPIQEAKIKQCNIDALVEAFELVPDVLFWIKDLKGHWVYANKLFIEHLGCHSLSQIYGKTDFDFFPPHLAKQYVHDDKKLLEGDLITSRLEMNMTRDGELAWFSTSKRPLRAPSGEVVGNYGITRHFQKSSQALSVFESVRVPVEYIRQNYHKPIKLQELAELTHLSVSALERRFKKHLLKTPSRLINEVRLENARRLIMETNQPISEIAFQTGFSDHSYFTKQFKQFFGVHPSKMRSQIKEN